MQEWKRGVAHSRGVDPQTSACFRIAWVPLQICSAKLRVQVPVEVEKESDVGKI